MINEQLLIHQAQEGDMDAFRELVEGAKNRIYRLAYDLTGSRDDAEDLSQEVFVKAYRSLASFRGEAQWSTWLYRITVNTHLDRRKGKSILEYHEDPSADRTPLQAHAGSAITPDKATEARMIQENIENALGHLTPRERSVFVLRHYHDLPLKEIAATLDVTEGSVKSLLFRAIRRLQQELSFYRDREEGYLHA